MTTVEELLTAAEVAALLKTQPETITSWAKRGIIPAIRINRKVTRYRASEVLAALENEPPKIGGVL